MTLNIISSEQILYSGEVTTVTLPGTMGSFTVLKDHASLISTLTGGLVIYVDKDGAKHDVPVDGGIVSVDNNIISVCVA